MKNFSTTFICVFMSYCLMAQFPSSIIPINGVAVGGYPMILTFSTNADFQATDQILWGATLIPAASITRNNVDKTLTFLVLAGTAGTSVTFQGQKSNGNVEWTATNGFSYDAVLSSELADFKVSNHSKTNVLTWKTANEKNLNSFIVERSTNGNQFTTLGAIKSSDFRNGDYSFIDNAPLSMNYYRLRLEEKDGLSTYSKIVMAAFASTSKNVKVYPNPVGTEGELNIEAASDIQNIRITNALGQIVLTSYVSKINIAHLAKGLYNVTVKTNEETMTQKFFKN